MSYYGTDDYEYIEQRRTPRTSHNELRRSAHYLNPDPEYSFGGRPYSGARGHTRTQFVEFYRDQAQNAKLSTETRYSSSSRPYHASPELRGYRFGNEHVGDFAGMALRDHIHSSSHQRSEEAGFLSRPEFCEWQLIQKNEEIDNLKRKQLWERENELQKMKDRVEIMIEAEKAEEEKKKKRVISEHEEKKRIDIERAKAEEIRIKEKVERENREAKDKEDVTGRMREVDRATQITDT